MIKITQFSAGSKIQTFSLCLAGGSCPPPTAVTKALHSLLSPRLAVNWSWYRD